MLRRHRQALIGVWGLIAAAAQAGPPYLTDDTSTPAAGVVELDFTFAFVGYLGGGSILDTPYFQFNYSPADSVQVGLSAPWTTVLGNGGADAATGIGDLDISCKWRFLDDDACSWVPAISTTPDVTIPTGDSSRGLGGGQWRLALPIEVEKAFGEDRQCFAFAEFGLRKSFDADVGVQMFYGVAVGRNLSDVWSVGIELNGNHYATGSPAQVLLVNGVVEYSLSNECTIGLGLGYSILSDAGPRPLIQLNLQCFF